MQVKQTLFVFVKHTPKYKNKEVVNILSVPEITSCCQQVDWKKNQTAVEIRGKSWGLEENRSSDERKEETFFFFYLFCFLNIRKNWYIGLSITRPGIIRGDGIWSSCLKKNIATKTDQNYYSWRNYGT